MEGEKGRKYVRFHAQPIPSVHAEYLVSFGLLPPANLRYFVVMITRSYLLPNLQTECAAIGTTDQFQPLFAYRTLCRHFVPVLSVAAPVHAFEFRVLPHALGDVLLISPRPVIDKKIIFISILYIYVLGGKL